MKLTAAKRGLEHPALKTPRDFALDAAAKGYKVLPLVAGGKKPLVNWKTLATDDIATVTKWFDRWPNANYGIACGPSGLVVVDLDVKTVNGIANWAELTAGVEINPGFRVDTPSGGQHLYWFASGFGISANADLGIDVRGAGGFVVGPGSVIDGVAYTVVGVS